ncbi:MAG TPA: LptA/OstA family protein [Verrucomicrobiae bacterium]
MKITRPFRISAPPREWFRGPAPVLLLALSLPLTGHTAQGLGGIQKGFKAAQFFGPPRDTQMQSLLQAERVQPVSERVFLLTGLTLQTFRETGDPELLIKAPQCLYDADAKSASSPGALRVTTADGKFSIEGEGFFLRQTNSSLVISNRVLTLIDPELLNSPEAKGRAQTPKPGSPGIEIRADRFEYTGQTGGGLYERNVRVAGTNDVSLTSDRLAFQLPFKERQLQALQAQGNVVADRGGVHATGQSAVYSPDTGLIRLTGDPAWRSELREGRGDLLIIDRTNRVFRAEGNAWVRMPAQGLSLSALLSSSNSVAAPASKATNQFVEIASGYHEFRTNQAVFGEHVALSERMGNQPRGTLTCGLMNVTYTGSNQLDTLVAQQEVVLREGTNRLSGGKAVFTGRDGVLQLTESPAWSSGQRSGTGELIRVDTRTNEMLVQGKALMRLPASELAQAADPRAVPGAASPAANAAVQWAEVRSAEYTLSPQQAQFRGGVEVTHPKMNWSSGTLTVQLPASGGQVESIVAERSVVFDLLDDKGQKVRGTGDQVVYTYEVTGTTTNDQVVLIGAPAVLEGKDGTTRNKTIVLDRANHKLITRGDYQITSQIKGLGTNALVLPNSKLRK